MLSDDADDSYVDLPEMEGTRKGGVQMHALLLQGSRCCCKTDKNEIITKAPTELEKSNSILIRCVGSKGCHQTWVLPRNR